jgi:hypothetical protein
MQKLLLILLFPTVLVACSGGGDGGGGGGSAPMAPVATTVSGMVTAPGGAIAFNKEISFQDFFSTDAYAALNGLVAVPDGTIVELARFTNGTNVSVITTTSTLGGRYSFNLGTLGLQPTNDLFVRVTSSNGKHMRAFVVGSIADISPVSEAACQLIQSLGSNSLANFTLQEVSDLTGAVWLISINENIGSALNVEQAVNLVKSAVQGNNSVMAFLSAAAQAGQTTQGTSDVGNVFPFEQGNIWRYQGRRSLPTPTNYHNTILVSGQGPAPSSGVSSTIFSETNSEGDERPEKDYQVKGPSGIVSHGTDDSGDNLIRQLVPFQAVRFPLTPGTSTVLIERAGLNWGSDEDGDGRNETFSMKLVQTVFTMESITVPAGTFANSLRVEFRSVIVVTLSRGGQATVTQINTDWQVPGVGMIKEVISVQINNEPASEALTAELEGYVVNGQGSGLRIEVTPTPISINTGHDKGLQATAFDMSNNRVVGLPFTWLSTYPSVATIAPDGTLTGVGLGTTSVNASLGGLKSNSVTVTVSDVKVLPLATNDLAYDNVSRKIYVSQPGTQGRITTIDPVSGSLIQSTIIGNEPGRLALSDDGQSLYVSIDNENAVKRLTVPALTTDLTFSLTNHTPVNFPGEFLCGKDMKVVPGNSGTVVVAVARHGMESRSCVFNDPDGAAVFQNGTMLPNKVPSVHYLEFSDSASLLFSLSTFSPASLSRLAVTGSGLSLIDSNSLANWSGRDFKFLDGLIYTASGDVINASTYSVVGSYSRIGAFTIRPDPVSKRLFTVTVLGVDDSVATVQVFDVKTLSLIGSLDIPNLAITAIPQYPRYTGLVRWGSDGLAFRTSSNEVVIVRSPLIGP